MGNILEHIWKTLETKWKRGAKELDLNMGKNEKHLGHIWETHGQHMVNHLRTY